MTQKITIDSEFRALIPPLTLEERQQLEENIKAEGCRDALVVWKNKGILLDGHNRLEMCAANGVAYAVKEIEVADRAAAKEWIVRNQFGRRNLEKFQRYELLKSLENVIAAKAHEKRRTSTGGANPQLLTISSKAASKPIHTREQMAKLAGISEGTIGQAKIVDRLAPEEVKQELRKGSMTINKAYKALKKEEDAKEVQTPPKERKLLGVGVFKANECINILSRIPQNDGLRKQGFRIVMDWIKDNM